MDLQEEMRSESGSRTGSGVEAWAEKGTVGELKREQELIFLTGERTG